MFSWLVTKRVFGNFFPVWLDKLSGKLGIVLIVATFGFMVYILAVYICMFVKVF